MPWLPWLNIILGIWLIISPWVLGFSGTTNALWNAVVVGILVVIVSAAHLLTTGAARPKV